MWWATPAEAEKRFKAAYEGERNTLQVVDAYGRFLAKRGRKDEALKIYKAFDDVAPRHPVVRSAMKALEEGKPLPPLVTNAQDGAAELLYGLGVVGNTQGRRADGDHLPAPRPRPEAAIIRSPSSPSATSTSA